MGETASIRIGATGAWRARSQIRRAGALKRPATDKSQCGDALVQDGLEVLVSIGRLVADEVEDVPIAALAGGDLLPPAIRDAQATSAERKNEPSTVVGARVGAGCGGAAVTR